jgi:hypothetical protein
VRLWRDAAGALTSKASMKARNNLPLLKALVQLHQLREQHSARALQQACTVRDLAREAERLQLNECQRLQADIAREQTRVLEIGTAAGVSVARLQAAGQRVDWLSDALEEAQERLQAARATLAQRLHEHAQALRANLRARRQHEAAVQRLRQAQHRREQHRQDQAQQAVLESRGAVLQLAARLRMVAKPQNFG